MSKYEAAAIDHQSKARMWYTEAKWAKEVAKTDSIGAYYWKLYMDKAAFHARSARRLMEVEA